MRISGLNGGSLQAHDAAMACSDRGDYLDAALLEVAAIDAVVREGAINGKPRLRTIMILAGSLFWLARKAYLQQQKGDTHV